MANSSHARLRLDELLVRRGLFQSRSRARDAILRGTVTVNGGVATKPGLEIADTAALTVDDPASRYVSRAALKLIAALDAFALDPAGSLALDLGASTGGFTQVLLERGVGHVVAVDVGHGQMEAGLRADPRVTCLEGINARDLTASDLGGRSADFIVSDMSFISLRLATPPALRLAAAGAACILLVKPQFEIGRDGVGKGGLLRNAADGPRVAEDLRSWLDAFPGWRALGVIPSPVKGGDGNTEFLLAGRKDR